MSRCSFAYLKLKNSLQNIVGMELLQLNIGIESRKNKWPVLLEIRESEQIEHEADVIEVFIGKGYYQRKATVKT